mmetsp:Transcript_16766/g.41248  ORF Transcript_16766/g.41248 Transcript_16766/m.41248 type:complete len:94 (-) Transcript_16766:248-529(-)
MTERHRGLEERHPLHLPGRSAEKHAKAMDERNKEADGLLLDLRNMDNALRALAERLTIDEDTKRGAGGKDDSDSSEREQEEFFDAVEEHSPSR